MSELPPIEYLKPPLARPLDPPWARPALPLRAVSPLELSDLTRRQALAGLLVTVLLALFTLLVLPELVYLGWVLAERADRPEWAPPQEPFIVVLKLACAALSAATLLVLARGLHVPLRAFGLHRRRFGRQLLLSAPTLIAIYCAMLVIGLTLFFFFMGDNPEEELRHRVEFVQSLGFSNPLLIVVTMIFVAIHEEIVFRGLLLPFLRRTGLPWWIAIGLASTLFGILHLPQGWTAALQITGVAVVLSVAFVLTRSLITVIVAHALFDLMGVTLMKVLGDQLETALNG